MDRPADENPHAETPSSIPASAGDAAAPVQTRPLLSGDTLVAIIIGACIIAAAAAWLWHYEYRRVPQTFWGFESPKIFRDAKEVTAYLIRPEGVGVAEKPQYYDSLFMIDEQRFVVVKKKDIAKDEGLPAVRAMLNDYTNYQKSYATWSNPNWRFALEFHFKSEDPHILGDYTAMIVFDADCKLGRPQTVKKEIATDPMSAELLAYFDKIFPEAKELKNTADANVFTRPLEAAPEASATATPSATTTGTADVTGVPVTTDSERLTTPSPAPSATAPGSFGPSAPSFERGPSSPFATPAPAPTTPVPAPTAVATPTAAAAATAPSGPSVFTQPLKVGPGVLPQMPGLPGLPSVGGPSAGPLVPAAPGAGLNIDLGGGQLNPPSSPLYQGVPAPGGVNNLSVPTPISVPALQGAPKPSGTK